MKICSKCKQEKPESEFCRFYGGRFHRCKSCEALRRRLNYDPVQNKIKEDQRNKSGYTRLRQKNRRDRTPEKVKARAMARKAKNSGLLVPKPCELCGAERVEMHHPDYSKPLEVIWLCVKHHHEVHRRHP